MIMQPSYLDDLKGHIRETPDNVFEAKGLTKDSILSDKGVMERLWVNYQKSVEEYECDPGFAYTDALKEVLDIEIQIPGPAWPENAVDAPRFAVAVICERDVLSVENVPSLEDGVDRANELLEERMADTGHEGAFDDDEGKNDEWGTASAEHPCAWCNYKENWDAHVVQIS